jgi:hypothetical protein
MALQTDLSGVEASSEVSSDRPPHDHPRCLCRVEDGDVFAYAERGHDFIRASDGELWAVEREDTIVSARSGSVLAHRRGRVYFAADTDEPLYYERAV